VLGRGASDRGAMDADAVPGGIPLDRDL
jgi:hypothetical protein